MGLPNWTYLLICFLLLEGDHEGADLRVLGGECDWGHGVEFPDNQYKYYIKRKRRNKVNNGLLLAILSLIICLP